MDENDDLQEQGRGPIVRKHYTAFNMLRQTIHNSIHVQTKHHPGRMRNLLQPHFSHMRYMASPYGSCSDPAGAVCPHYLQYGQNRYLPKAACLVGAWSSDGRRFLIGTQAGDFTIWEGDTFKFDRVITAHHKSAVRALAWSKNGRIIISGDESGIIKYFSPQITFVKPIPEAHFGPIRGLSYSPTETKFVSAGDDKLVKIWDWERAEAEYELKGHLSEIKCVSWHPTRSLIVSGSKDNTVRLWDPRQEEPVSTIHAHKNTVLCCDWNNNENWLATGSRDFLIKLFDIRKMKEFDTLHGQNKEVCTVAWHPYHESYLTSGGFNGSIVHWILGHKGPHTVIGRSHNYSVNVMTWHPLGHVLATAANDGVSKFWCREPPGSTMINDNMDEPPVANGKDPLATMYGPVDIELASSVLPELNMMTNNNADAIGGGTSGRAEGGYQDNRQGGGRFGQQQRNYHGNSNIHSTDNGGQRNSYTRHHHGGGNDFETSSATSGRSYESRGGGRGGRGRGRQNGINQQPTSYYMPPSGMPPAPPPPPPGSNFHSNKRAATDFMTAFQTEGGQQGGQPVKRSRFS